MKLFFKKIARVIVRSAIYAYCKVVYRAEIIGKEKLYDEVVEVKYPIPKDTYIKEM